VYTVTIADYRADEDSFDGVSAAKYTGNDVTDDAIHPVSCDAKSSLTRATVVLDAHWSELTSAQRVAILRRFAEHTQLPVSLISLLPSENAIEVGRYRTCEQPSHNSASVTKQSMRILYMTPFSQKNCRTSYHLQLFVLAKPP